MSKEVEDIFILLFWGIGIGGVVHGVWALLMSVSSSSWPTVIGEIVSSGIDSERDSEGTWMYEARMKYKYKVRGKTYTGKRIGFGLQADSTRWLVSSALKKASRIQPKVKIRYRSSNPNSCTVLTGLQVFHFSNLAFFTAWLWVCEMALTSRASGTF